MVPLNRALLLLGWMILTYSNMEAPLVFGQEEDLSSELEDLLEEAAKTSTPTPLLETYHVEGPGGRYSLTHDAAIKMCQILGAEIASYEELEAAWEKGLDVCRAGWLEDGTVRYPLVTPHCGHTAPQIVSYGVQPHDKPYDVYCSKETNSGNILLETEFQTFHVEGPGGRYTLNFDEAGKLCQILTGHLSTFNELETAWKKGLDVCRAGWLADGSVRYPLNNPDSPNVHCGHPDASIIVSYGNQSHNKTYDAYCTVIQEPDPIEKGSGDSGSGSGDGVLEDILVEELMKEAEIGGSDIQMTSSSVEFPVTEITEIVEYVSETETGSPAELPVTDVMEKVEYVTEIETGSAAELPVTEVKEIVEYVTEAETGSGTELLVTEVMEKVEYATEIIKVEESSQMFTDTIDITQPPQDSIHLQSSVETMGIVTTPQEATSSKEVLMKTTKGKLEATTMALPCSHRPGLIQCLGTENCIPATRVCDGFKNCPSGDDEMSCGKCIDLEGNKRLLRPDEFCDGVQDCSDDYDENLLRCLKPCRKGFQKCEDNLQCLHENLFCDGIPQCRDKSDEDGCDKTMEECAVMNMFSCDGVCKHVSALCDRTNDCLDKSDEKGCNYQDNSIVICPNSYFRLSDQENGGKTQCIHKTLMETQEISNEIKEELEALLKNPAA